MTAGDTQILTLYKQGLSAEAIAEALELDVIGVKGVLASYVSDNKLQKRGDTFTDDEFTRARDVLASLIERDDIDNFLRFRCARFIIDENKGRNDARARASQIGDVRINITNFNLLLSKARSAKEKLLHDKPSGETIDVELVAQ
jgi:hypothetical protein